MQLLQVLPASNIRLGRLLTIGFLSGSIQSTEGLFIRIFASCISPPAFNMFYSCLLTALCACLMNECLLLCFTAFFLMKRATLR